MKSSHQKLLKFGLTGGIGTGKSIVAAQLRAHGITVIDLDVIGKEVTEETAVATEIERLLGPGLMTSHGKLDRVVLRKRAFADPSFRKTLEGLLHPLIWDRFEVACEAAEEAGDRLVICEAALLVESGLQNFLDRLIVVTSPEAVRKARLMARDGIDAELAKKIIEAQADEADKVAVADVVLTNEGTLEDLKTEVDALVALWKSEGLVPAAKSL